MLQQKIDTDSAILENIRGNNMKGWEELYEKYAASMLGIICKLTNNKKKGEQLLIRIFTSSAFEQLLKGLDSSLPGPLYKYTFSTTLQFLKSEGQAVDAGTIEGLPGIFRVIYNKEDVFKMKAGQEPYSLRKKQIVWLPIYGANRHDEMLNYS